MSEEEIIKEINIIKETIIGILKIDTENYIEDIYNIDTIQFKAIEGLLDLYKKEKEKNKELIEGQIKTLEKILQPQLLKKYVSKDKIRKDLETCQKVYEEEMKPYQTECGLNVTGLSKKEKEEVVNKRNCLITQMKTYEMLLEE